MKDNELMQNYKKTPLRLVPPHIWLRNRVSETISALSRLKEIEDWDEYKINAFELAKELIYSVGEWDKYYTEMDEYSNE